MLMIWSKDIYWLLYLFITFPGLTQANEVKFNPWCIGNPILEIRRSYDRLISKMGFPILVRCHLYIESRPWSFYLPNGNPPIYLQRQSLYQNKTYALVLSAVLHIMPCIPCWPHHTTLGCDHCWPLLVLTRGKTALMGGCGGARSQSPREDLTYWWVSARKM